MKLLSQQLPSIISNLSLRYPPDNLKAGRKVDYTLHHSVLAAYKERHQFAADQFCFLPSVNPGILPLTPAGLRGRPSAGPALTPRVRVALVAVLASSPGSAAPPRAFPSCLPSLEPAAPLEPRHSRISRLLRSRRSAAEASAPPRMIPWRFAGLCCSSSRRASPPAWGPALECGCEPQETCRPLQTTVYLSGQDFCGQHLECLPPKAKHSGRQKLNSALTPSRASEVPQL
ncbi:uncharacterized protein LOC118889896 [Balaenoptera musculus]|uniref:Uncharacterized protein LOC118889896 n=1 Tax=Balaenoptera musculus TaxID=9771 RepID=A0A8B8WL51_BALMU|nr:uncharacterized protein LOC118889896 [Balaenoptera musculus]